MKRKLMKVAAVASSLTLVGAYVGYRAFGSSTRSDEPPTEVSEPEVLLPGSKSAEILPLEEKKAPERFMGGSKSAKIAEPEDIEEPVTEKPAKKEQKKPSGK